MTSGPAFKYKLFPWMLLLLLGFPLLAVATRYYVAKDGSAGVGTLITQPWDLSTLNAAPLKAGDTVLFRRTDVFAGVLKPRSGVYYGAYGTGANPRITGLRKMENWKLLKGHIYYTTVDVPELNVVVLNGAVKAMGRFPRTGFIKYTSNIGNRSIGGEGISSIPFDPAGGEVVIRKSGQIMDRHHIRSRSGNTLNLETATPAYGTVYFNNNNNTPNTGNGLFIQNHLGTLAANGDWYYSAREKKLFMYFETGGPAGQVVEVASADRNIDMNNLSALQFNHIDFEGSNGAAAGRPASNISNIVFTDCNFSRHFMGFDTDNGVESLHFIGGSFTGILSSAILGYKVNDVIVDSVFFRDIGIIAGAAGSGDGQQIGVSLSGNKLTVRRSSFINMGYHGIVLNGSSTLIEHNYINGYGLTKSDCGAIYDYQFAGVSTYNKVIRDNIILNGIGVTEGNNSPGQAAGIYMDENVNHTEIYNNKLYKGNWGGILLLDARDIKIYENDIQNFGHGALLIIDFKGAANLQVYNNRFVATGELPSIQVDLHKADHIGLYGSFTNNTYRGKASSIKINRHFAGNNQLISLAQWQKKYGKDAGSKWSLK